MFLENKVDDFETRIRLICGLRERINVSRNSLVIYLMNNVAWSSSDLRQKCEKIYICIHELTASVFFCP